MKRSLFFLCFAAVLFVSGTLLATPLAITVSVNPSTITNDYVGKISLTITNISTSGRTVRVERFMDANGNGVIDAGEVAVQSFLVTDGQLPLIGGVRNANVPGDEDNSSNAVIHVDIPYPGVDNILDHIAAQYIYKVSDFNSVLAPGTASLTITQQFFSQGITGQVTSAVTGFPLTNTPLILIQQQGKNGIGTVADAGGNYIFYCAPGSYVVMPVRPGIIGNQAFGGVTVSSNSFVTLNLTNQIADRTISGRVTDSATSGGIAGLFLQAQTGDPGLFAPGFTDTNGNYSFQVNSGPWKVKIPEEAGVLQGYVGLGNNNKVNADTSAGSVTNINFQLSKATALIYGSVKDDQTNPVVAMPVTGDDQNGTFGSRGASDVAGNYSVGALAGTVNVQLDGSAVTAAGFANVNQISVTLTNGQTSLQNFVLQHSIPPTAHLRGYVYDNNGNPLSNIPLVVNPVTPTNSPISINLNTAGDGSFDAGVYGGNWSILLECNFASSQNLVSPQLVFAVTNGVDINNIAFVVQNATAQINGVVTDNLGHPVGNLNLNGNATINGTNYFVGCISTDTNGFYSMNVFSGSWTVSPDSNDLSTGGFAQTNRVISVTGPGTVNGDFALQLQPIFLGQPARVGGQFQFNFYGVNGRNYRIDGSTNLVNWLPLQTNSGSFFFGDSGSSTLSRRFYRAVQVP